MTRAVDLTGQVFGRLTVVAAFRYTNDAGKRKMKWRCQCACGNITHVSPSHLIAGRVISCNCYRLAALRERGTHHASRTPEYVSWCAIKQRCDDPKNPSFSDYGGRGITVCDRWRSDFAAFLADMGPRPTLAHSIDRIDVNGHYEPGNCRWATAREQARNKRSSRLLTFRGETLCLVDWARRLGVVPHTIRQRLHRWSLEKALATPVSPKAEQARATRRASTGR